MRILFVTRKYPPSTGGMEVYSHELFQALSTHNPQTTLYRPAPPIMGRPSGWQLLCFFLGASRFLYAHREQADVVLLGDVLLSPLALLVKIISGARIRVVVAAHGNDVYFAHKSSLAACIYRWAIRFFRHRVDMVIANSSDTEATARKLGFDRTTKVLLGTRMPNIDPVASEDTIDAILFAGRLIHCKGLAWFIEEVMPRVHPDMQLLVAGPKWDASEMSAVRSNSRATYLGTLSRSELDRLRSRVVVAVMPNLPASMSGQNEGFGLSALESPAVGTPVVVSGLGGLIEAVVEGGTGFVVPPLDAAAFAEKINTIRAWTSAQRATFSCGAKATIAQQFSWDRVAKEYLSHLAAMTARPVQAGGDA